ncbi:MAG: D-glycero-beta-D-manno-heptose 1-phosphate adenylyltransferase, partial [Pseudomonadota bacterium]
MKFNLPCFEHKIIEPNSVQQIIPYNSARKLVFTNGCFDILHRGHVTYLAQAKCLGTKMIVALNSDASVKRQNKGSDRPINSLSDRLAVIASLQDVDFVTYFNEDTPLNLIMQLKPEILVKGGDWTQDKIVGSKEVISWGGSVYSIPFLYNSSTTKIISKIR